VVQTCTIVATTAGVTFRQAYRMSAKLAFAVEHCYWASQGYECIKASRGSLHEELAELTQTLNT